MSDPRRSKKSESLEIRIPYPTKAAFMARCRAEGRSASEALRGFIDQHLDGGPPAGRKASRRPLHLVVGVTVAVAIGAVALPSLARPAARTEFARLDRNGDDQITRDELSRIDTDGDGRISFDEYRGGSSPTDR